MASSPSEGHTPGFEPDARHPRGAGLLLFDLDDTIVQAGTYVSPRVLDALKAAHEAGYTLSIASGRPLCSVNKKVLACGVMEYAVCTNGATVVRIADGHLIASRTLSRQDALDCFRMLRPFKPAYNAFFDGKAYFEWKGASYMLTGRTGALARSQRGDHKPANPVRRLVRLGKRGMRYVWRMVTNASHRQVPSVYPHLRRASSVEKIGCTIPDADACARAAQLLRADGRFEVVRMGATELEITAHGVTKGTGASLLMDALGIDPATSVAFGDGGNDLPLAEVVGRFVAMGNADADVKAAATEVCESVYDDGVALWIERELQRGA